MKLKLFDSHILRFLLKYLDIYFLSNLLNFYLNDKAFYYEL